MSLTVFITGAGSGIGLEAARALSARGERVIASGRDARRCAAIASELGAGVETVEMDMGSVESIRTGVRTLQAMTPALDVLINNAGVLNTKGRSLDTDGREMTWGVNVLGPFLLSELLVPTLEAAQVPRVVNVGSVAYKVGKIAWDDVEYVARKYSGGGAYAQSKLALLLLTREFAKRHPGIHANCVHPGGIATGIYRNLPAFVRGTLARFLPQAAAGAVPLVMLATESALDGTTGKYFNKTIEAAVSGRAASDVDAERLYALLGATVGVP